MAERDGRLDFTESPGTLCLGASAAPGLLFGMMLLGAVVCGYLARLMHVPRVVGYLIAGILLKLAVGLVAGQSEGSAANELLHHAPETLEAVRVLALGIILFSIGGVFERSRLRSVGRHVARISLVEVSLVFLLVASGCAVVLAITDAWSAQALALAILLGIGAIATAPAATLSVLEEYESKGPITDTVLGLTGVNNVVCIVLFHAVFLILVSMGVVKASGLAGDALLAELLMTTLGSVVLGAILGLIVSVVHMRRSLAETLVLFFGLFVLAGEGEKWLALTQTGVSYNFLLASLVAGAVFANVAVDSQKLEQTLRVAGAPLIAGFFVLAGYELHITDFRNMGWLGVCYILLRCAGKELGVMIGVRWAGAPQRTDGRLGEALLCQAAVIVGLASFVKRSWDHPMAAQFSTVVLGSIVIFEMIGPLLLKRRIVAGGEVKALTLLSRIGPETVRGSFLRLAFQPFIGRKRFRNATDDKLASTSGELTVKHIMRTNVQALSASATFDDVLHFIERSTYNHFPVVRDDGSLAGVIHFSDVRDVIYDPTLHNLVTAEDLVDPDSPHTTPDTPLAKLLESFSAGPNVDVIPVTDGSSQSKIVGVVQQRDLLRAMHVSHRSS